MQATLTSKAQITLPKGLRDLMGLTVGDKVEFTPLPDGSARVTRAGAARATSFSALQGILPKPTKALTIDEMNLGLSALLAEDNARIGE